MTTSTPTTKILAIGTINPGVDPAQVFAILPNEVRDTMELYLNGKIDQWYSQQERKSAGTKVQPLHICAARLNCFKWLQTQL
jgi:hypothetical protein